MSMTTRMLTTVNRATTTTKMKLKTKSLVANRLAPTTTTAAKTTSVTSSRRLRSWEDAHRSLVRSAASAGNGNSAAAAAAAGDNDDDEYKTYADVYKEQPIDVDGVVAGASLLNVSRAFTADIAPEALASATGPDRGVLQYVRLPAEEYNVLDSKAETAT